MITFFCIGYLFITVFFYIQLCIVITLSVSPSVTRFLQHIFKLLLEGVHRYLGYCFFMMPFTLSLLLRFIACLFPVHWTTFLTYLSVSMKWMVRYLVYWFYMMTRNVSLFSMFVTFLLPVYRAPSMVIRNDNFRNLDLSSKPNIFSIFLLLFFFAS